MARKATDLLDVFRFGDDDDDDNRERETSRGRRAVARKKSQKAKKARAAEPKTRLQGLILNRRQVLLGTSAVALLLVLSFVLGLSTGRSGPSGGETAIQKTQHAPRVAIRGSLPELDSATRETIDPRRVADILKRDYKLKRHNLTMRRAEGRLVIEVGPFRSDASAAEFLRKSGLEMLHLHMEYPFRWPEYVAWHPAK